MTFLKFRLLLAFLFLSTLLFAQTYPIRTSVRLIPPFSGYLPEYGLPGSEKLKVLLLLTDFSKGQYTVKLQFKLEGQGISITTKPGYNPAGIVLDAGVPFELTGELLNSYLAADNLDFNGIDLAVYQKRQTLPEGHYSFCVTAYAYNSPSAIQVSNNACAMAWLMQTDPPRINTPICGSSIKPVTPQQVLFKWLPMGAASPNAAGSTEYELSLYEIRPEGRNPNDVIASSKPVYQTTTDFTTYVYGLEATPLTVGMEYAWRVQAKDKTGKDLIKNGGYSETCTFTYGNKLDEQSLTLSSKTVNYTQAKLSWDSLSPFKPFTLNYRKKGSEFWFETTSDSSIYRLNNLEPATSYEARVKGLKGSYISNWSNTTSFTTPIDSALSCGTATPVTTPTNTNPLLNASPGMVFKIGRFELTVTKISGGNGTYTGSGSVKVPFLKAALNVRYENIFVNEDKVVTTGEVKVVNDKVSDWVNDNTIGTIHNGQNTVDHVIDFTTNTTNITVNGNSITIKGNNGQSTVIDHTPGTETTIKDAGGNLYVVDKNGQTTQIGTAGNGSGAIAKNLNYLNTKDAAAAFTPVTTQQYGFDALTYPELKLYYEQLSDTATAKKVAISWKSVRSSKTDVIDVTLDIKNKAINSDSIFFITGTGTQYTSTGSGNKRQLRILGGEHGDVQELFAAYRDNKKTVYIGKLNIVSYKPNTKKVVLVPFALKGSLPDAAAVQEELNKIYTQAITGFEVNIANPLTLDQQLWDKDNNGRINAGSDGLSRYSAELKAINSSLRKQSYYDKSSYYILVTSLNADSLSDLQGEMPRGRNIGYSFNTSTDKEKQTLLIAHELGHGAFALEHTFSGNTPISKATTDNLMDYANGKHLHKYQWNYVQQPVIIIGALEEDEDAAASNTICNKPVNKYFLAPNGKVFTLPDNSKLEPITSNLQGFLTGFSIKGTVYLADIDQFPQPAGSFKGYKSNTNTYSPAYLSATPAGQPVYVCGYKQDKVEVFELRNYSSPDDADEHSLTGTANYLYPTGIPVCVINISTEKAPTADELFNSLKSKPIKGTVYIFKDNTLLKFEEGKQPQKTPYTTEQLKTLKKAIDAGSINGSTTVLFEEQANHKYTVTVGFNNSLEAKAGYGSSAEIKKRSKQILEDKSNAYLDKAQSLTTTVTLNNTEAFNDGKKIGFNKSQSFYSVIVNVVHDAAVFIQQAEIPPSYYNDKNKEYLNNWVNTPPLPTGIANGFVNEAKDIPVLIAFSADIIMNEQVRNELLTGLKALSSWEVVKEVASNTVKNWVDNYTQGGDLAWHQAGKDAVAAFSVGKAALKITASIKNGLEKKVDEVAKGIVQEKKLLTDFLESSSLRDVKRSIIIEKLEAKFPNLTLEELVAIRAYTFANPEWETPMYKVLNDELRSGDLSEFNKVLTDLLNSGLNKLPRYKGEIVFHGCGKEESKKALKWVKNQEIIIPEFKSSTKELNVAKSFMDASKGDVIFEIKNNNTGYDICVISCLTEEAEVLFKSGSKFIVKDIDPNFMVNETKCKKIFLECK